MTKCKEYYEQFDRLRQVAKEVKGYCEVDAHESIRRFEKYVDFCKKHELTPLGGVTEKALRPLIAERNADIAPLIVPSLKSALNKKGFTVTGKYVRRLISENRKKAFDTPPFPNKKYRCLVIDPPWPVQKIEREERPNQDPLLEYADYPTMTLEEISDLPIPELADSQGCHIYLWVTHKLLPEGLKLFEAWGVKYQCPLTWVKPSGMTPFSWMYNTEHILFGRIGHLELLQNGVKLAFQAPNYIHSRKPDVFYEVVRTVSPPPRLDMYARETREGFESYGNEVTKFNGIRKGLVVRVQV